MALTITIAVCTHDRPETLRRALASARAQEPSPDETLVVDNAPTDDATREMLESEFPEVRRETEPVLGLDFARNAALREAKGDVVAFVDDDVVLEADAVDVLRRVFADDRVAACTGRVTALCLDTDGQRLFEANGGFDRGEERVTLPDDEHRPLHGRRAPRIAWALSIGSGSCLAVRREAARAVGGFDEALDLGAALPGGGDHDMMWRLLRAGHRVVYEPELRARHEHRKGRDDALRQIIGHQRGLIAMLVKSMREAGGADRRALVAFLAWRLLKPGVRIARRLIGRDVLPVGALLRMWGACLGGLSAYDRARRLAARRREAAA